MNKNIINRYLNLGYKEVIIEDDFVNPMGIVAALVKDDFIHLIIAKRNKRYRCVADLRCNDAYNKNRAYKVKVKFIRKKDIYKIYVFSDNMELLSEFYIDFEVELWLSSDCYFKNDKLLYIKVEDMPFYYTSIICDLTNNNVYELMCDYDNSDVRSVKDICMVDEKFVSIEYKDGNKKEFVYDTVSYSVNIGKLEVEE